MSNVTLLVNGQHHQGWKEVNIRRSLESAADTFELTLTDRWAGQDQPRPVAVGAACEVWIDNEKIITGYVDAANIAYDASSRSVKVTGRSKVADLIDCTLPAADSGGVQFNKQSLFSLAKKLATNTEFKISVVNEVSDLKPMDKSTIEQGQTIFEFLEERARSAAVMLVSNNNGNLVITRASQQRITTPLVLGENIVSASATFDNRDRYSRYVVTGQQGGGDETYAANAAHIVAVVKDERVTRYRPTVIQAEGVTTSTQAERRAKWQCNVRYGRSRQIEYTVNGWRHTDGLWQSNRRVNVRDPWLGVNDEWWMIATVQYQLDDKGERTRLTVMPPEAFDLAPALPPVDTPKTWSVR